MRLVKPVVLLNQNLIFCGVLAPALVLGVPCHAAVNVPTSASKGSAAHKQTATSQATVEQTVTTQNTASYGGAYQVSIDQQRELAVSLAKAGQPAQAIVRLQQLHQQFPHDDKVVADLIILLRQNRKNQEIRQITEQNQLLDDVSRVSSYAWRDWIVGLRDSQAGTIPENGVANGLVAESASLQNKPINNVADSSSTNLAFQLATQLKHQPKFDIPPLYYAMLAAEAQQPAIANQSLANVQTGNLKADEYAQMAYVYRIIGQPDQALYYAQKALTKNPQQRLAIEQKQLAFVQQQREQAIAQAKTGQPSLAIVKLQQLHQQYPNDYKIVADLIVVLRLSARNLDIRQLTGQDRLLDDPTRVPAYAWRDWVGGLRDSEASMSTILPANPQVTNPIPIVQPETESILIPVTPIKSDHRVSPENDAAISSGRSATDDLPLTDNLATTDTAKTDPMQRPTVPVQPPTLAFQLATKLKSQPESTITPLYYAIIAAEAKQPKITAQSLAQIDQKTLSPDQSAQLAYIYRLINQSVRALNITNQVLAVKPQQRLAQEQKLAALRDLEDYEQAYNFALQHPKLADQNTLWLLQTDLLSQQLQLALIQKDKLEDQGQYAQARTLLDVNIANMQQALTQIKVQNRFYDNIFNDYMYTLRVRERMPEVIAAYENLTQVQQNKLKPYAKRAVADAYLATQQPEIAHRMYQKLFSQLKSADAELYIADYYALIEQENYAAANQLLQLLDEHTSKHPANANEKRERVRVEQVKALNRAYQNDLETAERALFLLVQKNPDNIALASDYATILNWRGLPQASDAVVQHTRPKAPFNAALDIVTASNSRDLQQYPRWQSTLLQLQDKVPANSGYLKSLDEYNDRQRFGIQTRVLAARSRPNNDNNGISRANGNRDHEIHTRITSPWLKDNFRPFIDYQKRQSEFPNTKIQDQRIGAGLEWQQDRKNAWLLVNQQIGEVNAGNNPYRDMDEHETGFSAGWSHWLNDNWRYRLGYDYNSPQIPLRALQTGLTANGFQLGMDWQKNESRSASMTYQGLDISDGNFRQSLGLSANQRLFNTAHHITTGGVEAFYDKNSQSGGNYFNPEHSLSYGINVEHDWLTWRSYKHSFTQHFELSTGFGKQADFSTKSYINALYQHQWQVNRRWQFNYGIGWGSQVYDGNREQRTYGIFSLNGKF